MFSNTTLKALVLLPLIILILYSYAWLFIHCLYTAHIHTEDNGVSNVKGKEKLEPEGDENWMLMKMKHFTALSSNPTSCSPVLLKTLSSLDPAAPFYSQVSPFHWPSISFKSHWCMRPPWQCVGHCEISSRYPYLLDWNKVIPDQGFWFHLIDVF